MSLLARCCCGLVRLAARGHVPVRLDAIAARLAVGAIRVYQKRLSGRTGTACLFAPSCSQRAAGWLEAHGFNAGIRLADAQLRRCGGAYSLSVTTQGETWLVTHDQIRFGPDELSPAVRGSRPGVVRLAGSALQAFDRDAALEAATLVFWRKGFAAASMNDLCEAMGIRSPSLYAAFGGKEALYRETLEHYVRSVGEQVWGPLTSGSTAREGVERLLTASVESLPESMATPAGCMAQLGATADEWPDAAAEPVKKIRADSLGRLRRRLAGAVADGELPPSTDVERLSRFYLGVIQGMAVQARDGAGVAELKGMAEMAMAAWPAKA